MANELRKNDPNARAMLEGFTSLERARRDARALSRTQQISNASRINVAREHHELAATNEALKAQVAECCSRSFGLLRGR